jgi:hypothetical protein
MADFQLAKEDYPKWLERPEGQMALQRARNVSAVTLRQEEELIKSGEWAFVEITADMDLICFQLLPVYAPTMMIPRSQRPMTTRVRKPTPSSDDSSGQGGPSPSGLNHSVSVCQGASGEENKSPTASMQDWLTTVDMNR